MAYHVRTTAPPPASRELTQDELAERYLARAHRHFRDAWRRSGSFPDPKHIDFALANALKADGLEPGDEDVERLLEQLVMWIAPTGARSPDARSLFKKDVDAVLAADPYVM